MTSDITPTSSTINSSLLVQHAGFGNNLERWSQSPERKASTGGEGGACALREQGGSGNASRRERLL